MTSPVPLQAEPRVVLSARGLGKDFSGFTAVNAVDLDVQHGRIHALIGPNGAGKTTVFNLLTKFLQPTRGRITLLGQDITHSRPDRVARMGLVRSFQISAVFPHLTARENLLVPLQRASGASYHFWRSQRQIDRRLDERAAQLLDEVDLGSFADVVAAELPYGRRRALELATTLAVSPEVLLLDEPTSGMGHEDIGRVADLIRRVARQRTVLMVEHNLGLVANLSDRITVLQHGSVLAEGSYAEVSGDARVMEAYMGKAA
jgi:branched-chain amino acid transport system ATP-binding protein